MPSGGTLNVPRFIGDEKRQRLNALAKEKEEKDNMRRRYVFCFIAILAALPLISVLQVTLGTPQISSNESGFSNVYAVQKDTIRKQTPRVAEGFSSDLPESFVLGERTDELSPREILELQKSFTGESLPEYTLILSSDKQSCELTPLSLITPVKSNGSVVALVANDLESGDFMWLQECSGVFPSFSQDEALEVLVSRGYDVQGDDVKLVYFDFESYWKFDVVIGGNATAAFVSFSGREIKLTADMVSRLLEYETADSCVPCGSLPSVGENSEAMTYESSYPSSHTQMVGKVPYFLQTAHWCNIFSMKMVFWWYGRTDISEFDIANYYGISTSVGGPKLPYMKNAFIHWLGNDDDDEIQFSWGSSDIETEKAWIMSDSPSICLIHAPGSPPTDEDAGPDGATHAVVLVGWDDSLGEGSWCIHDPGGFIHDPSTNYLFDAWISYSTFDTYWSAYWDAWKVGDGDWHYQRRGSFSVVPGDWKYPAPSAGISDETHGKTPLEGIEDITDAETLRLGVWLHNSEGTASDYASSNFQSQGVFVRLDGAQIVSVEVRDETQWFKSYTAYDEQGNEVPSSGANIIEFYTDDFAYHGPPHTTRAYMTIRPTRTGQMTVYYRGWMMDAEDVVREDTISVADDRRWWTPGFQTELAELRIVRSPPDDQNDRDNFLDYPAASKTCFVTDDDIEGPTISYPVTDWEIYDSSSDDISLGAYEIRDASGVSDVQIDYWYDVSEPTYRTSAEPGFNYSYMCRIPRSEWINHVGSDVYYDIHARDGDHDWSSYYVRGHLVTDVADTTSPVYLGWRILDDDVKGPMFFDPLSVYDDAADVYRIQVVVTDPSGIHGVRFKVKLGNSWSDWHAPSGLSGSTYWYEIPKEEWIPHAGETISWVAEAVDNDNDRPRDAASSQSVEYPALLPASSLLITGESPVNILVVSPGGLRVGYDPMLGVLNEILGASYSGPGTEPQEIRIPSPVEGIYRIDAFGTGTGTFSITVESFAADGSLINSRTWTGKAELGEEYFQDVQVGPDGAVKDVTPPTTDATLESTLGSNGWYTSPAIVKLEATDEMSGVAVTQYSFDSIAWVTYSGSFTIEDDGIYTVHFRSVDNDGNIEASRTISFRIDTTLPSVTMVNPPSGYAVQDGVTFIAAATDIGSGVNSVTFSIREDDGGDGIPVGFEDILGIYDPATNSWKLWFDTLQLQDGYYLVVVKATDNASNIGSIKVPYSIRNWAVVELLPSTAKNKAGRTMPIKFSLRVAASVDPTQPFVYNEELTIKIYATSPSNILQTSTYGDSALDYRIAHVQYITNFKTLHTPKQYIVSVYRDTFQVGTFNFQTVA